MYKELEDDNQSSRISIIGSQQNVILPSNIIIMISSLNSNQRITMSR